MTPRKQEKRFRTFNITGIIPDDFDIVHERIMAVTGAGTQSELAEILGIRQSSVSEAKRRKSIPADWYIKLHEIFGVSIIWLKTGQEPIYPLEREKDVHIARNDAMEETERIIRLLLSKLAPPEIAQEVSQTLSFKFVTLNPTNTLEETIYKIMPGELAVRFFQYFFGNRQNQ